MIGRWSGLTKKRPQRGVLRPSYSKAMPARPGTGLNVGSQSADPIKLRFRFQEWRVLNLRVACFGQYQGAGPNLQPAVRDRFFGQSCGCAWMAVRRRHGGTQGFVDSLLREGNRAGPVVARTGFGPPIV